MGDYGISEMMTRGIVDARRIRLTATWWQCWLDVLEAEDGVAPAVRDRMSAASWALLAELCIAGYVDDVERVRLWVAEVPAVGDVAHCHEFDSEIWQAVVRAGWFKGEQPPCT